ncbi:MAG: DUF5995 family protein [Arenibacter sp.]|nr:DUF5995 family protein [Arenibacter sp.]
MPPATTIHDVLEKLDAIIAECISNNNRMGLFAYIYRRTTAEIASEITLGNFEDNPRMEMLDVAFANLYLDAYTNYKNKEFVCASWTYAFHHAQEPLTIVQHIMLGMNTHINLDLAIATATTMSNTEIRDIEADFMKVNDILFQIVNEMQDRLSRVSPLLFLLDWIGENKDEKLIDFSMRKARQQSWNSANLLWSLGADLNQGAITKIDQGVLMLSKRIKAPRTKVLQLILRILQKFETKKVNTILHKLSAD